ncbi:DUF998 domain-containing protein [Jidongwangia harbinensis]|uniref:DUF998 domain-containing protein n=1 Tax=Jidongwangia harbinensis TaxID=2878561 RepID=UPI001CD9CBEB|nr:DUF998 domain-containing protein [Jidongwangia harbinensis]MCA2215198.1 DUF998 domain-containing protein [Jidongwangia harbinensis]
MISDRSRTAIGLGAGAFVLAGATIMLVAVVAAPGPWTQGYVSEAGTAGQPLAIAYRWGLSLLALGVALLGPALVLRAGPGTHPKGAAVGVPKPVFPPETPDRTTALPERAGRPTAEDARETPNRTTALVRRVRRIRAWADKPVFVRSARLAATLLAAAAVLAGTSAVVPCSNQCPLPPFEPTTPADVVHTAASIVGMVLLAAAMAGVALADVRTAQRRLATVAVAGTVPTGGTLGLTMLLAGRGPLSAGLERLLLVIAVSWLIGTSLLTVLRNSVKVEPWNRSKPGSRHWNSNSPS